MASQFKTSFNLGLSAFPEMDQKTYPSIYKDGVSVRNAINILAQSIDINGLPAGGAVNSFLTKVGPSDYDFAWQKFGPAIPSVSATVALGTSFPITVDTTFNGITIGQLFRMLQDLHLIP